MKKLFLSYMLGLTSLVFAQTSSYNARTLTLFNEGNWDGLIEAGEMAMEDDQGSYDIAYRLAVAYYNKHRYFDSAKHFESIKKNYDVNNEYVQEYLYYSYLFSGRAQDALLISKDFPFHLKQKIAVKSFEFVDYLDTEAGIKISGSSDIGIENMPYFNLGLGQKLGYHVSLNHAYTSLSQNYMDFDFKQKEYYLNANIHVATGLTLIPTFHYVNISGNTGFMAGGGPPGMMDGIGIQENIYLYHFALKKQWGRFFMMPNVTYSNAKLVVDNAEEATTNNTQYGLDLGYTIEGLKDKLWIGMGANMLNDPVENEFIWNAKLYYQINQNAFLYIKYLNANTSNFSEDNARYYYNSVAVLVDKISVTFDYHFTPKFSGFINYQYENDEDIEFGFLFSYNTFIGGLKYDF